MYARKKNDHGWAGFHIKPYYHISFIYTSAVPTYNAT